MRYELKKNIIFIKICLHYKIYCNTKSYYRYMVLNANNCNVTLAQYPLLLKKVTMNFLFCNVTLSTNIESKLQFQLIEKIGKKMYMLIKLQKKNKIVCSHLLLLLEFKNLEIYLILSQAICQEVYLKKFHKNFNVFACFFPSYLLSSLQ